MKRTCVLMLLVLWTCVSVAQINTARMLDMGRNAIYFEDYVVAIQYFNQVIKAKPYLAEPYFWRGYAKLCLEDYQGAVKDCSAALEINPFLPKAYYCRAFAENHTGQQEAAVADLRQSTRFEPGNIHTTQLLIDQLMRMDRNDEALQVCDSFLVSYPLYNVIRLQRSNLMLARHDTVAAIQDLDLVLQANANNDMAYAQRAIIAFQQKQHDKALADIGSAIKCAPYRADYFGYRAIMRMNTNNLRGAMQDFDQSVGLDNKNPVTYFNRALLRIQIGDDNQAVTDLSTCIALDPSNYTALWQRALLQTQLGGYKEALTDYDQIIERYPDFVPAYSQRGAVKEKLHDFKGAQRDYYDAMTIENEVKSGKRSERKGGESQAHITTEAHAILQDLDRKDADRYKSEIRGQVQYKEVLIDPIPQFVIGIPDSSDGPFRHTLALAELDSLNHICSTHWTFCTTERTPKQHELQDALRQISQLTARMDSDSTRLTDRWQRAMLQGWVGNSRYAMDDCAYLAAHAHHPALYYFLLGTMRMKNLQGRYADETIPDDEVLAVARDFQMALHFEPNFAYACYNLGCAQLSARQFNKAIESFGRAIQLYGEFAEAYYNRGLIYLYQGNKQQGRDDLSRAGELGLHGAYNIIRRYGH